MNKHLAGAMGAQSPKARAVKVLPENHQLGMRVHKGGSMCANCEYLKSATECGNPGFAKWHGKAELPSPSDEYCCDLWEGA